MPGKIFISYRRDDDPNAAARLRDGLARPFGKGNVFLDVDHLIAGQRFDEELAKALSQCDVLLAVIGPRWMEQLQSRLKTGDRDYVREEIGEALKRRIVVIPVRVGRDGQLPPLPRAGDLPEDIQDLVHYQKHDVSYERFPRDMAELIDAIGKVRQQRLGAAGGAASRGPWAKTGIKAGIAVGALALMAGGLWQFGLRQPPSPPSGSPEQVRAPEEEIRRRDAQLAKLEADRKTEEARNKAAADAETKRKAEEAERQRVAAAEQRLKELDEQQRREAAAAEAKRKADEEAARRVPQAGQSFRDCNDGCLEMVVVPASSFTMGSPANEAGRNNDEGPQRTVTIRQPFAVGKFEVTFAEWEACVVGGGCTSNRSPSDQAWGKGRRPVINVSRDDAKQYVSWLSRKTGKTYRLLSEAEWEYAARAGTTTRYSWGNDIDCSKASYDGGEKSACYYNPGGKFRGTQPVGNYAANKFGLHDMHGNVWEWVEDCYADSYKGAPADGSAARDVASCRRVLRGGSWDNGPVFLRSAVRLRSAFDRSSLIGFRVGRTLTP